MGQIMFECSKRKKGRSSLITKSWTYWSPFAVQKIDARICSMNDIESGRKKMELGNQKWKKNSIFISYHKMFGLQLVTMTLKAITTCFLDFIHQNMGYLENSILSKLTDFLIVIFCQSFFECIICSCEFWL